MKAVLAFLFTVLVSTPPVWADLIHLKNGGTLEGVVLKNNEDGMVVLLKYASVTILSADVESIEKSAEAPKGHRIADWQTCFKAMAARPWGPDLRVLSAPLVDSGDLKNVPYVIHASDYYEFALYGDPDAPARVEVGISGALRWHDQARKDCVDLVASFLRGADDADALRTLALKGDKQDRSGIVFEIDEEADSRGKDTWWVSITDPRALEAARVSDRQLASLISAEAPQSPRNPTLVENSSGKGVTQEVITPFGTEPESPRKKSRRTYGGGGHWGGHVRWNHGHVLTGGMK
jgi:hypothetical protein